MRFTKQALALGLAAAMALCLPACQQENVAPQDETAAELTAKPTAEQARQTCDPTILDTLRYFAMVTNGNDQKARVTFGGSQLKFFEDEFIDEGKFENGFVYTFDPTRELSSEFLASGIKAIVFNLVPTPGLPLDVRVFTSYFSRSEEIFFFNENFRKQGERARIGISPLVADQKRIRRIFYTVGFLNDGCN